LQSPEYQPPTRKGEAVPVRAGLQRVVRRVQLKERLELAVADAVVRAAAVAGAEALQPIHPQPVRRT
jgi:hypothetical protein